MINVSEALDQDTAEILTVERFLYGEYVDGIYQKGNSITFQTLGSPQQPTPNEIMNLPEGERNNDIRKFYTKKRIYATEDRDDIVSDFITYEGVPYKVIKTEDNSKFGYTVAYGARGK